MIRPQKKQKYTGANTTIGKRTEEGKAEEVELHILAAASMRMSYRNADKYEEEHPELHNVFV